ncbi:cytochrome C oxidase subunit IV family protein [Tautonia sociabilis]|uniref:Oxidase n=1 Tax=Tautonia sociabilis TaxID=2080755 RepID=A0A432MIK6_9BACT|nr:cytochrome C oxidase subunit IV family protein [Tautonia sociabilis]RUL87193.1 oxidase [Tautonia sociabilis]
MDPTGTPTTVVVAHREHSSHVKAYLRVFLALLALTVAEYLYARLLTDAPAALLIGGLLVLAVIKAGLVGLFFMHLLFEGRWKYLVLVPTTFLASVTVLGLVPDLAYRQDDRAGAPPDHVASAGEEP